jgi:hypothetical protein
MRGLMRTIILIVAVLAILGWGIFRLGVLAATIDATWSYDYTRTPACSPTLATDCIDHFEVLDITNQSKHRLIETVKNPEVVTGKSEGISAQFKYGPAFGEITFSVVAVKRNQDGSVVTSNPYAARAAVRLRPGVKASLVFF